MSCLLITSIFAPINGGSAVVYENLCQNLEKGSIIILTATCNYSTGKTIDGWEEHDNSVDYPIYRLKLLRSKIIKSSSIFHSLFLLLFVDIPLRIKVFTKALQLVKKHKVTTLCVGDLNSLSWLGKWLKIFTNIKVINYIHGEEVTTEANYKSFQRARSNYLKDADAIIAVSYFTKDYLINRFRLSPQKITVITNGVNTTNFTDVDKLNARLTLRDRYNLKDKKIFITVGRLVPRKGIDTVIKSLPHVLESHPDAHYLIVGTGPIKDQLENIVTNLNLSSSVTFAGNIDHSELVAHYNMADVFIMPNRTMPDGDTEGFGLVFLEANACGIPVIAGRAGGASDAVINDLNGISVDGLNENEVSMAMLKLLDDPGLAEKLAAQGKVYVQEKSFAACAIQFNSLCETLK
ncbi:glycosyltransferase family 4 protein [Neptunomonas antarctica]|uniref:Phosphatidylinositol alpha-1,6-mannosyltransferase n=1 Tax=Neptunomonas antarctica TaxID=619304 RepID=A0A1N7JEG5_9GAMM|nr:glycosyltransferase family 4 protein [Neptunomonas antarctica]SIS47699.1 phosphatidylinositol alpha-1,6-mannosyltransferase [Neptunomonas antarctica]